MCRQCGFANISPCGCSPVVPTTSTTTDSIFFKGTNQNNFQNFVGATGKASDAIPYTMLGDGTVVGFATAINGVNLLRNYTFYITADAPLGYVGIPPIVNQIARIELVMNEEVSGTLLFSCVLAENGIPFQARASLKGVVPSPYVPINAFATWTTIKPGAVVFREQALALYLLDKIGNEEASFQVFIQSKAT
ncbi:MAG: hypothetical protein RLZZ267_842 [Bacillota bacterium]